MSKYNRECNKCGYEADLTKYTAKDKLITTSGKVMCPKCLENFMLKHVGTMEFPEEKTEAQRELDALKEILK